MAKEPYNPTVIFEDSAVELARCGRDIALRDVELDPAAARDQWRSYARMERKLNGEGRPSNHCINPSMMHVSCIVNDG